MRVMQGLGVLVVLALAGAGQAETVAKPGFDGLDRLPTGHPSEALALPGVEAAVKAAVGADWPVYQAMISHPGKGGWLGSDYYGSACPKADCDQGYATLYIDPARGEVYVTWTDSGALYFRPTDGSPDDGWPDRANETYEFWPDM
jgi:hypothetical protein